MRDELKHKMGMNANIRRIKDGEWKVEVLDDVEGILMVKATCL